MFLYFALVENDKPKNVVLGVSGGIACYKAVELVRLLVKEQYTVQVIMTRGAMQLRYAFDVSDAFCPAGCYRYF